MEKQGYREMLAFLTGEKGCAMMLSRKEAQKVLGVSHTHLTKIIQRGHIKLVDNKVPIGSIASYLCG